MSDAYTGQVERDPHGGLWAVLYRGNVTRTDAIVKQEPTRSVKRGMKRVEEMILSQADADTQLIAPAQALAGRHRADGRARHLLESLARHPKPTPS